MKRLIWKSLRGPGMIPAARLALARPARIRPQDESPRRKGGLGNPPLSTGLFARSAKSVRAGRCRVPVPPAKRILCALLCLLLLMSLCACETQADRDYAQMMAEVEADPIPQDIRPDLDPENGYKPTFYSNAEPMLTPVPGDDLRGELKIKMGWWWNYHMPDVATLAEEFKQLHPYVSFSFDYPEDYNIAHTYETEQKEQRISTMQEQVSADLMCRSADYIIYDPSRLVSTFHQMSQNGLFIDLLPYIEEDPELSLDDFFPEVLNTVSVDGQLTLLPYSFYYDITFLNRSVLDELGIDPAEIETVTTTQLLDWYEQARAVEPDLKLIFGSTYKGHLFSAEQITCYDLDHLTASFDSPDFASFLARSRDVIHEEPAFDNDALDYSQSCNGAIADEILRWQYEAKQPTTFSYCVDEEFGLTKVVKNARRSFATVEVMDMCTLANLQYPLEYMAGPYPLLNSDGQLRLSVVDAFAVPACHPNPELAWEFIRYCMSERNNMSFDVDLWHAGRPYTDYIPANRANFRKMAEWLPEYVKRLNVIGYPYWDPIDVDILQAGLDFGLGQELVNSLAYNLSMDDYFEEFYDQELTTPEECAKKMQGRAEIWLNE